jgi:hypothetical protein
LSPEFEQEIAIFFKRVNQSHLKEICILRVYAAKLTLLATTMSEKVKIDLEFLLKTSPRVLENMLCTPSGLSEWFADDVNIKDDVYTFFWDGSEDKARLITKKPGSKARFQWIKDEEEGNDYYFEMRINVDDMTKDVAMQVTDFADKDEEEDTRMLWEQAVSDLKRVLGA